MLKKILIVGAVVLIAGCNRVDQQKFDAVHRSATALNREAVTADRDRLRDMISTFQTDVAVLRDRVSGSAETRAARLYSEAADAYTLIGAFRYSLSPKPDTDTENGRREWARYGIQTIGSEDPIEAYQRAMNKLNVYAEEKLIEAQRIVRGR